MKQVRNVLPAALANEEILRVARAQSAMRRWVEVVGPTLAEKSHPDRFGRGTLWVAVQGSAWAQELRMMKDRILNRLAEVSGEPALFKDVRFGVRPLPPKPMDKSLELPLAEERDVREMSIQEIAARRLAKWKHEERD